MGCVLPWGLEFEYYERDCFRRVSLSFPPSQLDCERRPHKPSFSPPHPQKGFESVGSRATNGHRKNNSSEWGCPQVCCDIFPQGDGLGILEDVLRGSGVTDP